jgi:hypothetical protein
VDSRSNQNAEQVLINVKPGKDAKWSGRILDPNTGCTYDSTIAMKGDGYAAGSGLCIRRHVLRRSDLEPCQLDPFGSDGIRTAALFFVFEAFSSRGPEAT